jgi:hypothetical protein
VANIALAFQPENGINLDDLAGIFAGTADPTVLGEAAPIGSLYLRTNGMLFQKIGSADTAWMVFSQGLGEAVKISATDTNAGYLNAKLLVTSSLSKSVQNAGANETLTLDLANVGTAGTYTQVTTNAKGQVTAGTNPTTLAGYGITNGQPLDATLTALAAYATVGFVAMTATDVFAGRTMTGTANQITVTNGAGTAGNPTFSFPTTILFPGTTGVRPPSGTTAQRVATAPYLRYNTDTTRMEYFNGTVWVELVASTGGTVTSVATSAPAQGLTISGGPVTTSGTLTFALANDLAAVEGLVTTGFATRTATDTWATWAMAGTTDRITVTNGDGSIGAPTFDIAATYVGQTSITTLGNISTGTWLGTTVDTAHGGTGRTSIGTANTLLGVNTTATGLEYKNLVAGAGITIAPASQQITITNTGVTSITGTANQVIASAATGAVTLSLPQSIGTGSSPTFAQVTLAADPTTPMSAATKQYVDARSNGLIWRAPIFANGLLDDSITAPPSTPNSHDSYIVPTGATGVWTGLAGHLVEYTGVSWVDLGLIPSGTRIGISLESGSTPTGTFAGKANQIVTVTGTFPYSYAYTAPSDGDAVLVSNPDAYDAYHQYTYVAATSSWIEFSGPVTIDAGTGLAFAGNTLNIADVGTAGTYNNVTTNAQGQVISGSSVAYLTGNQNITLSGDVTGVGSTSITTALSATGVTAGTYKSVTVDAKGRVSAGTNPTTLAGYGISDAQGLDAFLTALANASTDGIMIRSGDTVLTRAVIAGSTKVSVANGDGIAGNPSVDVIEANLTLTNIGGTLSVAKGGTNLTSLGAANQILGVNAGGTALEYKAVTAGSGITITPGANSITIAAVNSGTVTSVAATGSTGLTVGGSPITSSGTLTFTLGTELQGLSALSAVGLVTRTAAGTYASRSVVSGVGTISITNPTGAAGNVALDLTTVGTAGTYRSVTTDTFGRVTSGTNPTTLAGYGITDAAPITTPFVTIGAVAGMANERALTGSANITITDNGANSTVAIGLADNPILVGTANLRLPVGTTAQRPGTAATGDTRFNTDLSVVEYYDGTSWIRVGNQPFVDSKMTQGFIDNTQSVLSFTAGTRTVTITPTGANFVYYFAGSKIVKTVADSVVFPNTNGLWFIYYDANSVLTASASFYDLKTMVPVAVICWDAANSKFVTIADERHNATMDWSTHLYLHVTNGTKYANGLGIQNFTTAGTGAANTDAQIGFANGTLYDEDLKISITHSATPTAEFEQVLSSAAKLPVLYRVGTGASNWTADTATVYPVKQGTARIKYNLNTAGTWSATDAGEGEYVAMWVFGSNGYFEPMIAFMGQRSDASLQTAKDNNTIDLADFGNIPSPETKILYRLIFQTSSGYANAPKARLVDVVDMRTVTVLVTSTAGANSHSLLSGLSADDHPQYVHNTTPRTISAVHTFNPITATAPFALGANATGQLVTGLNADTVDGFHAASFQPADTDLTALANIASTGLYAVTGSGTSTTRTILAPAAGITVTNGSGVAGNPTLVLANDLAGVEGLAGTGLAVRTATDTWTTRTLVAGSGISITNADGTAGNITIALTGGGTGTVTSVGLALPNIFTVSNSPVTTTGTLTGTLATQTAGTFFVGPTTGSAAPTFRTVSIDEMSDVVITTPSTNQVIAYNGTSWVNTGAVGSNAAGLVGVGQAGAAAWTLVSGSTYTADFAHNLGTTNVVITVFDSSTLAVVVPDLVTCTNTNTVRIRVIGNTRTLKVVVVANGQSIVAGGSTPSSVITAKDGVTVSAAATKLNFTGQAVNVTDAGSGTTNISIGARFAYVANSLDNPSNADFAVNALAPTTTDPTFNSLTVRSFSNTVEQGVGFTCSIPPNATQVTFKFRGRAATAPGAASVVQPRLYARQIPNNSAVGAWSAANELANISIPTNAFFQYATQTIALSTLGLTADRLYQFELTRRIAGVTGTNLASAFYLAEIIAEFA